MVKDKENPELTDEQRKQIHKEIEKTMANAKGLSLELEMTLDKLQETGYSEIKHPMFWYLILNTAMRVVRENTTEETFYDFMEYETNELNQSFKANEKDIVENKGRVN